nr:hypothetical protein Itr_chr03CG07350 [Ipomoea trifida]
MAPLYILGRDIAPRNTTISGIYQNREDFELENEAESPLQVIGTPLSTDLNDNAAED